MWWDRLSLVGHARRKDNARSRQSEATLTVTSDIYSPRVGRKESQPVAASFAPQVMVVTAVLRPRYRARGRLSLSAGLPANIGGERKKEKSNPVDCLPLGRGSRDLGQAPGALRRGG